MREEPGRGGGGTEGGMTAQGGKEGAEGEGGGMLARVTLMVSNLSIVFFWVISCVEGETFKFNCMVYFFHLHIQVQTKESLKVKLVNKSIAFRIIYLYS